MSFVVAGPVEEFIDGRRYMNWTVTESSPSVSDEWEITGIPVFFTLTLFEAAASSGTIKPRLGLAANWSTSSLDHVAENNVAAARVRNDVSLRVTSPGGILRGCSARSSSGVTVTSRVTVIGGH